MTDTPVLSAGHQLRDRAAALADAVVACEYERLSGVRARYGPAGRGREREHAVCDLVHLADAVDLHSPALFNDHVEWTKGLLRQQGLSGGDLELRLACLGEAVRERLPPTVAAPAAALIDGARRALPAMPDMPAACLDPAQRLAPLADEVLRLLLGGYRGAAARRALDAMQRGEPVPALYLQVFQPVLREIGRLWQIGRISVAQEHFASAATQLAMSQLLALAPAAAPRGRAVVVACVGGDRHDLGARMVADLFELDGWASYFCGADTPHDAVVAAVIERGADLLAVSATMGHQLHAVGELIAAVHAEPRCARLRVMVGGRPFGVDPMLWRRLGADGTAADAEAAVALADGWLAGGAPAPRPA